eukprot:TRINITY_DN42978_c0_g1_i1.p1 TRINITY_DN42978_c0_g1~~TRINITY_DN42978_c0_g1_i1.p1  ORF type:complete len:581 (-),score=147.03 TRINITY_DN42978_c0_g1_i1:367-2109(-)
MAVTWPKWQKFEDYVAQDRVMAANSDFQEFKKQVLKASDEEIDAVAAHASTMWHFLIAFAAKKAFFRSLIIQVFNKLIQVPSWRDAWEKDTGLHDKVKDLHEDLQSAIGAQHETLLKSIAPSALKSVALVKPEETPQEVRIAMERERMVDAIKEEEAASPCGGAGMGVMESIPEDAEDADAKPAELGADLAALQEGIDAATGIDDAAGMDSGGINALNKLRIGCIRSAGNEPLFRQELDHAPKVFNFLMSCAKQHPDSVNGVAEVMNQLMASPSWSSLFETDVLLKDRLRELPESVQAALGLQSDKVMSLISAEARRKATGGDIPKDIKGIADRMQSIRMPPSKHGTAGGGYAGGAATPSAAVAHPPTAPSPDQWKAAKTPEGHTYFYNLRTRESTWERPAALGGPFVYKAGDEVEVWSNGMRSWGRGKVEKVEGDKVTAEFMLKTGSQAKKELPSQHKDLRHLVRETTQSWSPQEEAAYRKWFEQVDGGSATAKPAVPISKFLWSSKLPREALKQVWMTGNPGSKNMLGFQEFAQCCRLVAHCQAMGDSDLVKKGERPLRVKLRDDCLPARPPSLPTFG